MPERGPCLSAQPASPGNPPPRRTSASPQLRQLPRAFPRSPWHRTISLVSKRWQSPQMFLSPNTHLGHLSARRRASSRGSPMGCGLSPGSRPASPAGRRHGAATPAHSPPANPSARCSSPSHAPVTRQLQNSKQKFCFVPFRNCASK